MSRRRAALVYNPAAGVSRPGAAPEDVRAILEQGGVTVRMEPTRAAGHATEIARRVAGNDSADWVLVYGGDGTVRETAKGLLGSEVALAPLSAGTTNVVTRSLGFANDPRRAARQLLNAEPTDCDIGLCGDEPFLMQATFGMDAAVMAEVPTRLKRFAGRAGIAFSGIRTWWHYRYPRIRYTADGENGRATFVAACNIARYAGEFRIAPDAGFSTRRLDLVTFTGRGRREAMQFLVHLVLGRHPELSGVSIRALGELLLEAPLVAPLQLDGDPIELAAPLRIRLADKPIRLLVPKAESR